MGELSTLETSGDLRLQWNPNKPEEVENARKTFEDLRKKGYLAFAITAQRGPWGGRRGDEVLSFGDVISRGKLIMEFDPQAEKVVATPPVVGG